jgi:hypothetical protein
MTKPSQWVHLDGVYVGRRMKKEVDYFEVRMERALKFE